MNDLDTKPYLTTNVIKRFIKGKNWEVFQELYFDNKLNNKKQLNGKHFNWIPTQKDWIKFDAKTIATLKEWREYWGKNGKKRPISTVISRLGRMYLMSDKRKILNIAKKEHTIEIKINGN